MHTRSAFPRASRPRNPAGVLAQFASAQPSLPGRCAESRTLYTVDKARPPAHNHKSKRPHPTPAGAAQRGAPRPHDFLPSCSASFVAEIPSRPHILLLAPPPAPFPDLRLRPAARTITLVPLATGWHAQAHSCRGALILHYKFQYSTNHSTWGSPQAPPPSHSLIQARSAPAGQRRVCRCPCPCPRCQRLRRSTVRVRR